MKKKEIYKFIKGKTYHLDDVYHIMSVFDPDWYHQEDCGTGKRYNHINDDEITFKRDVKITVIIDVT